MNPYINLKSYTEANSHFFKGRDNEIEDILSILKRSDVVILYSESAEGKSSLIGAGLSPRFRQMGFIPVNIVFTDDEFRNPNPDFDKIILDRITEILRSSNEQFIQKGCEIDQESIPTKLSFSKRGNESELYEWVSTSDIEIPDDSIAAKTLSSNLWWVLRNFAVERYAAQFHFVLIFDQFEEVFSHTDLEWVDSLFAWLEKIYSDKCPLEVSEALLHAYSEEELVPPFNLNRHFKEIFSMRNEYIGDLDYWGVQKHFMPELKNYRYCLKPLTLKEATEVVELGFKDNPDIKAHILSAVSGVQVDEINSVISDIPRVQAMLLSIVCSALSQSETGYKEKYIQELRSGDDTAIQKIVYDVYRKQIDDIKVSNSDRKKIEEALIDSNGKRVRIKTTTPLLKEIKFDQKIKTPLKKQGIIKSTKINGDDYVELVHDQLANAIYQRERRNVRNRRTIFSIVLVAISCVIIFGQWLLSGTNVESSRIITNKNIDKYSLAKLDEKESYNYSKSGGNLKNDPSVESYTLNNYNNGGDIEIFENKNLRTLYIEPDSTNELRTVNISGNIKLKDIFVSDSVKNLRLKINDNIGFCRIYLGRETSKISIFPRTEYLDIESADSSYQWMNNRLINLKESSLTYIPFNLRWEQNFFSPVLLDSLDNFSGSFYDHYYPFTITSEGVLDLGAKSSIQKIKDGLFENGSFSKVLFPTDLSEIGFGAFSNCKNLKQVVIPASVTKISYNAFDDSCDVIFERDFHKDEIAISPWNHYKISFHKLPQRMGILDLSEFSDITSIGYEAFRSCRFDSVILPPNLEEIGLEAFADCKNLKSILIPRSVNSIANDAFDDGCDVRFEKNVNTDEIVVSSYSTEIISAKLPQRGGILDLSEFSDITSIGSGAFKGCRFDSVILPPNLEEINSQAFADCKNLKSILMPKTVTLIANNAFDDSCDVIFEKEFQKDEILLQNDTITSVRLPQRRGIMDLSSFNNVKSIGYKAFEGCRFDSIILPSSLEYIEEAAFTNCKNLKNINIPPSVSYLNYFAFDNDCNLIFSKDMGQFIVKIGKAKFDSFFPRKNKVLDLTNFSRIYPALEDFKGVERIKITKKYNDFSCDSLEDIVYIGENPVSELVKQKKYIKIGSKYYKFPLFGTSKIKYKGTYTDRESLKVYNDVNHPEDVYIIGKIISPNTSYSTDSILTFYESSILKDIKSIHLSLPRPLIWTIWNDTAKMSLFSIDIPDSIKQGITLYVPYDSKRYYEENLTFKAFKEIKEDPQLKLYKDSLFIRWYGMMGWFMDPFNTLITLLGVIIVIVIFYLSFKKHYLKDHPYSSSVKTHILSALNGIIMGVLAILGFASAYWWVWDISHHNYFCSVICGVLGAIIALGLCYFRIFPYIGSVVGKSVKKVVKSIVKFLK